MVKDQAVSLRVICNNKLEAILLKLWALMLDPLLPAPTQTMNKKNQNANTKRNIIKSIISIRVIRKKRERAIIIVVVTMTLMRNVH